MKDDGFGIGITVIAVLELMWLTGVITWGIIKLVQYFTE